MARLGTMLVRTNAPMSGHILYHPKREEAIWPLKSAQNCGERVQRSAANFDGG
jgi:hypothetical protein